MDTGDERAVTVYDVARDDAADAEALRMFARITRQRDDKWRVNTVRKRTFPLWRWLCNFAEERVS